MIISFLGDSITAGAGLTNQNDIYYNIVGEKLGITALGYGIGGTRIAKQLDDGKEDLYPQYFESRVSDIDKNSDYVFVFGGTNDYGHGNALMGSSDDKTTFNGAVKSLITTLKNTFGENKIVFTTPLHRVCDDDPRGEFYNTKENGYPLKEYVDVILDICKKENVKVLDLFNNPPMPLPTKFEEDEYYLDGLHPTKLGHSSLANAIIEFINNNL